jgi:hypothetical protein
MHCNQGPLLIHIHLAILAQLLNLVKPSAHWTENGHASKYGQYKAPIFKEENIQAFHNYRFYTDII